MTRAVTSAGVQSAAATLAAAPVRVHRIEVRPRDVAGDPRGESVRRSAQGLGYRCGAVRTASVYLIEAALDQSQVNQLGERLLADPVLERFAIGSEAPAVGARVIEVHPLPGVMDPVAQTVEQTVRDLLGVDRVFAATGVRYDIEGLEANEAPAMARALLANPVIESIHEEPYRPERFPRAPEADNTLRHIQITALDDSSLAALSRRAHLFLSLEEMQTIQRHYRESKREPTDIELETLAQTWSEHCVHKTLKSTIHYRRHEGTEAPRHEGERDPIRWEGRPGVEVNPDGSIVIRNLFKSTIVAATRELIDDGVDWTLSVFADNAGVIAFDDKHAVCVKVETHNHPSAIEPYGGAATGVGGCIRDIIGTGLGAKPIANTDVFCVAFPDSFTTENAEGTEESRSPDPKSEEIKVPLPEGCLHPRRILTRVVDGVRDYGNRMGIPTVNGAVFFDDRYVGNPLVFCGCVGVMPRDRIMGQAQRGDRIVAIGGRTGRDGLHGATFSSAELTHSHANEFSHAVQIGNAIQEKKVLDAVLRARDYIAGEAPAAAGRLRHEGTKARRAEDSERKCLYSAITDCGAGGFSSAVGEMGKEIGAQVHLDRAPLKYEGLRYDEIWISESQERMVLAVPPENMAALKQVCDEEGVEIADLGIFGTASRDLVMHFRDQEVGRLSMDFLHDGLPMPVREAVWRPQSGKWKVESGNPATERSPINEAGHGHPSRDSLRLGTHDAAASGRRPAEPGSGERSNRESEGTDAERGSWRGGVSAGEHFDIKETLLRLLAHPDIASKRWIVRQYDHEVQGNTIIKPLVGPGGIGPGDATVIQPVPGSKQGLAIACGMATGVGDPERGGDPYLMALAAVDECVRNLVCVGADPDRIAILDNFCWPGCDKPENLASLVRAAVGCYDAAKAYRTPFISGKDSLNNQFTTADGRTIEIPPTLLITGVGIVSDVSKCVTMDLKALPRTDQYGTLAVLGPEQIAMGGSTFAKLHNSNRDEMPRSDPRMGAAVAWVLHELMQRGVIAAAHDVSEGGLLVAVAEMLIASEPPLGVFVHLRDVTTFNDATDDYEYPGLFAEAPQRYVLQLKPIPGTEERQNWLALVKALIDEVCSAASRRFAPAERVDSETGNIDWPVSCIPIGSIDLDGLLKCPGISARQSVSVKSEVLRRAFLGTLDW